MSGKREFSSTSAISPGSGSVSKPAFAREAPAPYIKIPPSEIGSCAFFSKIPPASRLPTYIAAHELFPPKPRLTDSAAFA